MITDKDIIKLKSVFATKDELENLDIRVGKGFADVQKQINGIKYDVSGLKKDVSGLKKDVSGLKKDVSDIKHNMLTMEDNILGAIHKLQIENSITASYCPKIENHEQRITKLEKLQFAN